MIEEKKKWKAEEAWPVANELCKALDRVCERVTVAGSLRRYKDEVGDVELLYVPKIETRQADMFSTAPYDLAAELIGRWLQQGVLEKRLSKTGVAAWGPQNKLAVHTASGVPVDLFATDEAWWWVSLVIRTGGRETNLSLAKGAIRLGRKLHAYGPGVTMPDGTTVRATSERHVFELCGVPYREPGERV